MGTYCVGIPYEWFENIAIDFLGNIDRARKLFEGFAHNVTQELASPVRICIYGAGGSGHIAYSLLRECEGIQVVGVADTRAPSTPMDRIPYINPLHKNAFAGVDLVFIATAPKHYAAIVSSYFTPGNGMCSIAYMYTDAEDVQYLKNPLIREESYAMLKDFFASFKEMYLKRESSKQIEPSERLAEYSFVMNKLRTIPGRRLLDVGTSRTSLPNLLHACGFEVVALDASEQFNTCFYVELGDIVTKKFDTQFDIVVCVSTLEHIFDCDAAMSNMYRLLRSGGHLIVTFPYSDNCPVNNIYEHCGGDLPWPGALTRIFARVDVDRWISNDGWRLVAEEYFNVWGSDYCNQSVAAFPVVPVSISEEHDVACLIFSKQ
ncbi:Ubiquinone biosynthesis O-methyltransferase [Fundidesulfovibrio magnetotacticus]|uniref:Ubiquinone biosynthesis O-methyltransferase n=1 Tax=Fundidesulfovibrio magnetotacticus TaxID=2730080 RepID=A0A6V8LWE6_9BACT|nr:class I SAM-dependent methyltransferase [Fundidesulfovibrio magnetotacticus]GFK92595.1 Ubiquinone biosynthesis O-methyltransferase [Fundidesulfovibrio magnetotacticus]